MNAELKEQVRVAAYDANNVPAISPDERIRVYTSKEHVCHCIPITNRSLGLTVPILEDGKTVEYWFEKGIRDVDLILKHNSSIGDEYVFDDNVFKVISPDQIKHRIYLKNPHISINENSFIYSTYNAETHKGETFTIGNDNNNTYLRLSNGENFVNLDVDNLRYYCIMNNFNSTTRINNSNILIETQYTNADTSSRIFIDAHGISMSESHNDTTKEFFLVGKDIFKVKSESYINLILDNNNSYSDILIKNTGHGDINIDSQHAVEVQGADYVALYGVNLIELYSNKKINIKSNDKVIVQGSGSISIYRSSNHIKTQFALDDLSNGYLMREDLYGVHTKVHSFVSVKDKQVLIRAYDDVLNHEYANLCHIELRTGDHAFHVATNKLEIGKLNSNNSLSYQEIPECIYPLMYDLKYTNKIGVANGGYWNGNASQTDLRDIQRFTSIFTDSSFITDSYVEFAKIQAPLRTIFNINVNGKDNLNNPIKNEFTVLPDGILYSINDSNSNLGFIKFTVTGIEYTQGSTTLSKTWQQLLS